MHVPHLSRIRILGALAVLAGAAGCDNPTEVPESAMSDLPLAVAEAQAESPFGESFRVYSRNIYLGGDAMVLLGLDFTDIPSVVAAAQDFWDQVESTDFQDRARAIAAEIALTNPHVVGLQEVAHYVQLQFDPAAPGGYAPTGGLNMAQVLLEELALAGADYQLMGVQVNTQGILPFTLDVVPTPAGPAPLQLLRFALGEATLVRSDLAPATSFASGNYDAALDLGVLQVKRGWSRVSLDFGGVPHHVVNTHLEVQGLAHIQVAQAGQLLGEVTAGLDGVTILMGDLNSNANAREGDRSWTPTYGMARDAGFADAWLQSTSHRGRGWTCCHDPDLRNAMPTLDERIDFVLYRSPVPSENGFAIPGPVHMTILGDEEGDRTAGGLWPADHAALFAGFVVPRGLAD